MSRSRLIATRTQLQLQLTNEGSNVYLEACRQFNDRSPGIQVPYSVVSEADNMILDTHKPDVNFEPIGALSPKKAFKILKDRQRIYAKCRQNFDASGQHWNNFWPFCQGNLDILILHHWLLHIGDPQSSFLKVPRFRADLIREILFHRLKKTNNQKPNHPRRAVPCLISS